MKNGGSNEGSVAVENGPNDVLGGLVRKTKVRKERISEKSCVHTLLVKIYIPSCTVKSLGYY